MQDLPRPESLITGPPTPTALDIKIGKYQGTTLALDARPETVQASKKLPIPTQVEWIEQLTKTNGRLRCELQYYRGMEAATTRLQDAVTRIKGDLPGT